MEKEQLEQIKSESQAEDAQAVGEPQKKLGGKMRKLLPAGTFKTKYLTKKNIIWAIVGLIVIAGIAYFGPKIFKRAPQQVYSVAIMVRSQSNPDKAEDMRSSLKAGDVLVTQKADHSWSGTEKVSYLIIKMNLTEEQAQKLTQAKVEEIKFKDLPEEERNRIEEEKKRARDEDREYMEEPRMRTLIAREYYIDLAENFPDFKPLDLLNGQPYLDQIFDWSIVDKKK